MLSCTSPGRPRRRAAFRPTSHAAVADSAAMRDPRVSVVSVVLARSSGVRPRVSPGRSTVNTSLGSYRFVWAVTEYIVSSSPSARAPSCAYPVQPTWCNSAVYIAARTSSSARPSDRPSTAASAADRSASPAGLPNPRSPSRDSPASKSASRIMAPPTGV